MRGLNLDHLRIFLDVIELGSFSAAADKHGLTQPAVSLQVRQLERRYGLRLAERSMQAHSAQVVGRVRLGTGATACTYLLPPLLADLRRRFPALEIVASTGNTADVLRGIEANTLDI